MDKHLGIGMVSEKPMPQLLKLVSQMDVIINLPVVDDHKPSISRYHRLCAAGQIDDGKPFVSEIYAGIGLMPDPLIIRPPMRQPLVHPFKIGKVPVSDESAYPAHV